MNVMVDSILYDALVMLKHVGLNANAAGWRFVKLRQISNSAHCHAKGSWNRRRRQR